MRGGATTCSVHQTLTSEAASVLKQSLGLARRRGHAQVTPLHVAFTLLSSRASDLLRRACLKSRRPLQGCHPLQCRALELCFNVALNRLPTITSSPPSGPFLHVQQPSLSNALVAALKRAQAHQRRGCIEQQQQQQQQNQPLLAAKVELEQLVLSILDDPSVSRVMREAGFSSTAVKTNIEDSLSSSPVFQLPSVNGSCGVFSSPPSPSREANHQHQLNSFWPPHFFNYSTEQNPLLFSASSPQRKSTIPLEHYHPGYRNSTTSVKEDVKLVIDVMLKKKRNNTVIVGDSFSFAEGIVKELKERLGKGEIPTELKPVTFIMFQFQLENLKFMKRDEVELKYLSDLRRKVNQSLGAIIYVGDLKWAVHDDETISVAVDHLIKEIGKLISDDSNGLTDRSPTSPRVWLLGTATFQTYMKCQIKFQPPLEHQWGLQPVSVPSGGLGLSLHGPSLNEPRNPFLNYPLSAPKEDQSAADKSLINCCGECISNYEKEAGQCKSSHQKLNLPTWLQPLRTDQHGEGELMDLRRKWSRLCHTLHQGKPMTQNNWDSSVLSSATSGNQIAPIASKPYSYWWTRASTGPVSEANSISFTSPTPKPVASSIPRFRRQNSCTIEFDVNSRRSNVPQLVLEPNLSSLKKIDQGREVKITLALGSESDSLERTIQRGEICRVIKYYVPWQSENIPGIVEALMDSGLGKKEMWLLIQGNDRIGKIRLASAIGELIFGSANSVLHLNTRKKNGKDTKTCDQVLSRAMATRKNLVVLVEDVEYADNRLMKLLIDRFEAGKSTESGNREDSSGQLLFLLAKGDPMGCEHGGNYNPNSVLPMVLKVNENGHGPTSDNKRKAEAKFLSKMINKSPRIELQESTTFKNLSKQSSFNSLDLNISAEEDQGPLEIEPKPEDLSPISSDVTRENYYTGDIQSPTELVESIEHRFAFNRSPARDREMREYVASRIKGSFDEAMGHGGDTDTKNKVNLGGVRFGIEDRVLEGVLGGGGDSFIHNVFEMWLRDIFQTCLAMEKINWKSVHRGVGGGGDGINVRLCLVDVDDDLGGGERIGFMSTNLPEKVLVE